MGYQKRTAEEAVEVKSFGFPPWGSCRPQAADEGQACQYRPFTGRRGNAALIRLRRGPQTPSPRGKAFLPKNFHHPYKTVTARAPAHTVVTQLVRGILYVGAAFIVFSGRRAYAALELAWRGTTHWTMFAAGGACLCLLQKLAAAPLPLAGAAALGAAGVSGLELAVGAVCRSLLHTEVWDYTAEWGNVAGLICPRYSFYWFLLCGWVIFVLRGVESTVYHPQNSLSDS